MLLRKHTLQKVFAFVLSGAMLLSGGNLLSVSAADSTSTNTEWNFSDSDFNGLGTISSSKTIDGLTLNATSSKTMKVSKSASTVNGTTYNYCLKLGGTGTTSYRSMNFTAAKDTTITVIAKASSDDRTLALTDASGNTLDTASVSTTAGTYTFDYTGSSKTLYLYSLKDGINIYDVSISTTGTSTDTESDSTTDTTTDSTPEETPDSSTDIETGTTTSLTDYNIDGFAEGDGVTGGGNISSTSSAYAQVSTPEELAAAIKSSKITVIEIMNDLDLGWNEISSTAQGYSCMNQYTSALLSPTMVESGATQVKFSKKTNLTIFSENGATIRHAGFTFRNCSNVMLRNISFDELWEWDEYSTGNYDRNDWDYVTIEGCDGVWIDHCTFHQSYDGCCDSKKGTTGLSVTYCNFVSGEYDSAFLNEQFDYLEKLYKAGSSDIPMYTYIRDLGISRDTIQRISSYQKKCCLIGATELASDNADLEIYLANNTFIGARDRMVRLRGGVAVEINNIFDSSATYEADQLVSSSLISKITSAGYHMSTTSQCFLSTEGGHLYASGCALLGIKAPLKNNQKSASNSTYTGYILAENCYYSYGSTTFTGSSEDDNSPLAPQGAKTALTWDGIDLDFTYNEVSVNTLMKTLPGTTGAGAATLTQSQWMSTTY